MKRRTKVHFGDTYGEETGTACGAFVPRAQARRQLSATLCGVTCEKCRRVAATGKSA